MEQNKPKPKLTITYGEVVRESSGETRGYVLEVVSGSVSVDADRSVRRNLTATL